VVSGYPVTIVFIFDLEIPSKLSRGEVVFCMLLILG
jgi:hypothetical protein